MPPPLIFPNQIGQFSSTVLTGHITPVQQPAIIVAPPARLIEDRVTEPPNLLIATGTITITDPNPGQDQVVPVTGRGEYGQFYIQPDGTWTYVTDNNQSAIQSLGKGDVITDSFTVHSIDGTSSEISVLIHGTNDPAIITTTQGDVTEDRNVAPDGTLMATGTITVQDPDYGQDRMVPASTQGTYGSFVVSADGSWTYHADNSQPAIQGMNTGQMVLDKATVYSVDGTSHQIEVVIHGANEPVTVKPPTTIVSTGGGNHGHGHENHVPQGNAYGYWSSSSHGHSGHSDDPPDVEDAAVSVSTPPAAPYLAIIPPQETIHQPAQTPAADYLRNIGVDPGQATAKAAIEDIPSDRHEPLDVSHGGDSSGPQVLSAVDDPSHAQAANHRGDAPDDNASSLPTDPSHHLG